MSSAARAILDKLPGLKQDEIKPCALCAKGIGHDRNLLFWRIKFDRAGLDVASLEQQHGLELVLGSAVMARVMGPDRDVAKIIDGGHEAWVCEPCALEHLIGLFLIAEKQNAAEAAEDAAKFAQCGECWQPATCKKYGCSAAAAEPIAGSSSSESAGVLPEDAVSTPSPAPSPAEET